MLFKHLKKLCMLDGPSGNEDAVREYILGEVYGFGDKVTIDPLGNVLVTRKGEQEHLIRRHVMVSAHMDEVGLIVTYANKDGTLRIAPVGGIDPSVLLGRQVCVNGMTGVIGTKPIHLLKKEERTVYPTIDEMYLDIGARSQEEAQRLAPPGTYATFPKSYTEMGGNHIRSKALDDRIGCAVLLALMEKRIPCTTTFAFLVQEEVGLRGAKAAAYTIAPDLAIVLEATTAADIYGTSEDARVCALGKGPVIPFMDKVTIYDRTLYDFAFETAAEMGIPCQTKTRIAGGNDAGAIHVSRSGVRTLSVSAPCRYLHSPSCVADKEDIRNCLKLTHAMLEKINLL